MVREHNDEARFEAELDSVEPWVDEEVVVLDVRPEEEYRAGHIAQALWVPPDQLEERIKELPRNTTIVAYCRGPFCLISYDAVELLRERGFQAFRLEDGFPEWKARNYPVETGQHSSS